VILLRRIVEERGTLQIETVMFIDAEYPPRSCGAQRWCQPQDKAMGVSHEYMVGAKLIIRERLRGYAYVV